MRTPGLPLMCFRSTRFLKINILQGSVVTLFRCGDVCNNPFVADFLLSVTVKELKKWSYFVEISSRVYSLLFWATYVSFWHVAVAESERNVGSRTWKERDVTNDMFFARNDTHDWSDPVTVARSRFYLQIFTDQLILTRTEYRCTTAADHFHPLTRTSLSVLYHHRILLSWERLTRKASCRWQTRATLAKRLHGLCKSSGVVSCVASLPIDSLPMVSYYRPTVSLCLKCTVFEIWRHIGRKSPKKTTPPSFGTFFWGDPLRIFRRLIPCQKLESWGYQTVYISWSLFRSARHNTGVWQTDGQTDRHVAVAKTALA